MKRPIAFILASTDHGTLIVNRNDYSVPKPEDIKPWYTPGSNNDYRYGVGNQILEESAFEQNEIDFVKILLDIRRKHYGSGLFVIDGGANIGTHTIEWAKHMTGWGQVFAFEPQVRIFYALAGNVCINNCFNAIAFNLAIGEYPILSVQRRVDYTQPCNFGDLSLLDTIEDGKDSQKIRVIALDHFLVEELNLERLDLIKLDIEGMEIDALRSGIEIIKKFKPILIIEWIKSDLDELKLFLSNLDYKIEQRGINLIAIHENDPCISIFTENNINGTA
jgi:FkbM family methyltransferase